MTRSKWPSITTNDY